MFFLKKIDEPLIYPALSLHVVGPSERRKRLRQRSKLDHFLIQIPCECISQPHRVMVLDPAKKDVKGQARQRSAADPLGLSLPDKAGRQWQNDHSGEDK